MTKTIPPMDPVKLGRATPGPTDDTSSPRAAAREARSERLAAALKANLRRRKAQARDRAAEAAPPEHDAGPARNGGSVNKPARPAGNES